jgi:hypothetical protein
MFLFLFNLGYTTLHQVMRIGNKNGDNLKLYSIENVTLAEFCVIEEFSFIVNVDDQNAA